MLTGWQLSEKAMELENVKNEHENENEQHAEEMQNVKQIHAEEVSAIQANVSITRSV